MVKYSIIIPVHNNEQTLEATMESVLAQKKQFDEIILVENGSTDCSLALVQSYANKDARIKVLITEQAGVSHARNVGIRAASGDYLFLLDGDDTIHVELLSTLAAQISQDSANMNRFDLYEVNFNHYFSRDTYVTNPFILPHGAYTGDVYLNQTIESFHEESKFMVWRFLYRKTFFTNSDRFFDESLHMFEDIAFMHKYLTKDVTIYVMGRTPLVDYLFHENSVTRRKERDLLGAITALLRQIQHPSQVQQQYFLAFAAKVCSRVEFKQFIQNTWHDKSNRVYVTYQKLTFERFLRRIKRRWMQSYD